MRAPRRPGRYHAIRPGPAPRPLGLPRPDDLDRARCGECVHLALAIAELRKDRAAVRTERGHRIQARLESGEVDGRLQHVELARGRADLGPAAAGLELGVAPELL